MGMQGLLLACVTMAILLDISRAGLLKKMIRHRRESLMPPKSENMTLPNPDQPVVFNHVYNINVPTGSLCSVDLDSPGGLEMKPKSVPSEQHIEHTVDGENQIVFTHRINIPKQACGCDNHMPDLKDLLNRLEMLEAEVSSLREQCTSGAGCCGAQVTGEITTKPYCNGRGNYSIETCSCVCEPGWKGPNCSETECPNFCQDQGRCVDGKCICFEGFGGEDCGTELCPVDCGEFGQCIDGACVCAEGYIGEDCSMTNCLNNCLGRGRCVDSECVCNEPWTGFDCSELICPNDCFDRGRCINGTCYCDEGFTGEDCGELTCPNNCYNKGLCVNGQCVCNFGYSGEDCSKLTCPKDCSKRGHCFNGRCICDPGFEGEDCSILSCPENCNDRGKCINGKCECDPGYQGDDCSERSCPSDCHNNGRCIDGQCICKQGFAGEDCSIKTCPNDCHDRGECVDGKCVCNIGFTGEDCKELTCLSNCHNRGLCVNGQCVCNEGFTGEDCSEKTCPNNCQDRGYCNNGQCVCYEGYTGVDCSEMTCPGNCNDQGRCLNGMCICELGFTGDDCSEISPPRDLVVTEVTPETVDLTWVNEVQVTEYLITYMPTAPGGLELDMRVPGEKRSATIKELEPGVEYLISVYAVLNNKMSVPVSARVATHLPEPEGLKFKAVRETSVEVQWDPLNVPFDGWNLIFRNTKEENGEILNSLSPPEITFEQSGLGPGQEYEVKLEVLKNNTRGPPASKNVVTMIDAPSQVDVRDVTDSTALITWFQPIAQVDSITMSYGPITGSADSHKVELSSVETQYHLAELFPDMEYSVSLMARRGEMTSVPVYETFTTDLDAPTNLRAIDQTDESITLEWTNSQANIPSYRIKYGPLSGGEHGELTFPKGPQDITQAKISGLRPGTEYGMGVTAIKDEKESAPSTTNAVTDLDAPKDLEVSETTETTMVLIWRRPVAKIDVYKLVFVSADGRRAEFEVPGSASTYILKNLNPGMLYTITLTAERGRKMSTPASIQASTDNEKPLAGNITISAVSWDGFNISWELKRGELDGFLIEVADPDGLSEGQNHTLSGQEYSLAIINLSPSTFYRVTLYGLYRGDLLEPVFGEAFTEAEPEVEHLFTSNTKPDGFMLQWRAPDGIFETFIIKISDGSGKQIQLSVSGDKREEVISGLDENTDYEIELFGTIAGRNFKPISVKGLTGLGKPKGIRFSDVTDTTATVHWTVPSYHVDSFQITYVPTHGGNPIVVTVDGTKSQTVLDNLTPGVAYQVSVISVKGLEQSEPASDIFITGLGKPKGIRVSDITETSATVLWTVPGYHVDSFQITYVPTHGGIPKAVTVDGTKSQTVLDNLTPGVAYQVSVISVKGLEQSEPASDIFITGLGKPKGIRVSDITETSATVHWTVPSYHVDSFQITYVPTLEGIPKVVTVDGTKSQTVLDNLTPGVAYQVSVISVKGLEQSEPASDIFITGLGKPKGIRVSDITETSATVHWTVPIYHVDSFQITYVPTLEGNPKAVTVDGTKSQTVLDNLTPGVAYQVSVISVKGLEQSEPASDIFITGLGKPKGIRVSDITETSATVHWTVPHYHIDGYRVTYVPVHDGIPITVTVDGSESQTVLPNLTPGVTYQVKVISVKGTEESAPASERFTTGLGILKGIRFTDVTDTSSTVHWTVPHYHVDNYRVTYAPIHGADSPLTVTVDGGQSQTVLPNLTPGVTYRVSVISVKGLEKSEPASDTFTTGLGKPMGIRFSDVTDKSATVHWTIPRYRVDSYKVTYVPIHEGRPMTITVDGGESQTVLPNLTPGVTYEVSVISVKGLVESEPASDAVTTALDKPHGLVAVNITDTTALLHWQPTIATVDGYVITYSAETMPPITERVSGNTVEFEMSSLYPGTEYTVKVYAVREAAKSAAMTTQFTTDIDSPEDLEATNIQTETATLTWKAPQAKITGYLLTYESADGTVREVILSPTSTSYNMNQLSASTEYTVYLKAISGPLRSHIISSVFTTIGVLYRHPKDCSQALLNGDTTSGLYTIYLRGDENQPLQVYCDMTTDGGGWIVFVRRQSGKLDFFRNWRNYTAGFGDMNDEFWLGLSNLHKITSLGQYELRVDLRDKGEQAYAQYDKFAVSEPRGRYKVHVGGYSGTAGDSMTYHNGRPFSTYDNDNDIAVTNCALSYKGAFWYKNCHRVNIMGRYGDNSHSKGVNWFHWKGHEHSIEFAEMKIRPSNFRNFEGRRKRS
ncbi:tenascin-like isoform X1 [Silurus asotus]|uniref:Tenascin-like isoform X1 n=1 Tax=Silurus asotus TaxID=30991 RepID=A0AAD5FF04_SILAS|nr:tenascin-like isoform X1 [Silurus asotus]